MNVIVKHVRLQFVSASAQMPTGGDDSKAWLLSAAKWTEVKVHPGSSRVMLSLRWEDKQRLRAQQMKGDKRD